MSGVESLPAAQRTPRILCAGIAVHDHVYRLERFPAPGSKTRAKEFIATGGGCAANAAVAIARLGGHAALASPLGDDAIGDRIVADLVREGVDCGSVVRMPGARSPISAILVDSAGERLIVNDRDERLSVVRAADPARDVAEADAILADNRFADFVLPYCMAGRARGLPVILDGDRPTQSTNEILRACTHIVFAADGLRATAECDDLGAGLRTLACWTDAFLAVTDGERGVLWLDGHEVCRRAAFPVHAVDTLGAGDVFHGAFALALAQGKSATAAIDVATAAGGLKCTRFGGISSAPTRAELEAFLALDRENSDVAR